MLTGIRGIAPDLEVTKEITVGTIKKANTSQIGTKKTVTMAGKTGTDETTTDIAGMTTDTIRKTTTSTKKMMKNINVMRTPSELRKMK